MKRYWFAGVCIFLFTAFLAGCGQETTSEDTVETVPASVVTETTLPLETGLTEADILNLFYGYAYADPANREAIDCVVVTDFAYDLIGVVLYTTEDQEGCFFDFLNKDGNMVGQVGVGSLPAEKSEMKYLGNGALSCQMLEYDGNSYLCKIYYTYDEENGTNFKLVG